jgi:hypothetical protein
MSYNTIVYSHSLAFYITNTIDAILLNMSKQLLDDADDDYIIECIDKTIDVMKNNFDGYIFYNANELLKIINITKIENEHQKDERQILNLIVGHENNICRIHIKNMFDKETLYIGSDLETFRMVLSTIENQRKILKIDYLVKSGSLYSGPIQLNDFETIGIFGKKDVCVLTYFWKSLMYQKKDEDVYLEIKRLNEEIKQLKHKLNTYVSQTNKVRVSGLPPRHPNIIKI